MFLRFQTNAKKKSREDIMNNLKYIGYSIVFQEVPDEISLVFNVSGCPHKCEGCHSQYLWEDKGRLISEDIDLLIKKYNGAITCVCFMGGDHDLNSLQELIYKVKSYNLNVALYSGFQDFDDNHFTSLKHICDYIKVGPYIKNRGGLNNAQTNQKMFKYNRSSDVWQDITYRFQERLYGEIEPR